MGIREKKSHRNGLWCVSITESTGSRVNSLNSMGFHFSIFPFEKKKCQDLLAFPHLHLLDYIPRISMTGLRVHTDCKFEERVCSSPQSTHALAPTKNNLPDCCAYVQRWNHRRPCGNFRSEPCRPSYAFPDHERQSTGSISADHLAGQAEGAAYIPTRTQRGSAVVPRCIYAACQIDPQKKELP